MAVWCMLMPHKPYRLLQHFKRNVCVPSCSCKKIFTDISSFCVFVWSEQYMLQYATESVWNHHYYSSHRSMQIFNKHWRPMQVINQMCTWNFISQLREMHCCNVLWHLKQGCWAWRDAGGPYWLHKVALNFREQTAYEHLPVHGIGVNKILPY